MIFTWLIRKTIKAILVFKTFILTFLLCKLPNACKERKKKDWFLHRPAIDVPQSNVFQISFMYLLASVSLFVSLLKFCYTQSQKTHSLPCRPFTTHGGQIQSWSINAMLLQGLGVCLHSVSQRDVLLELTHGTFFGKSICAEVINSLDLRSSWISKWAVSPVTDVLPGDRKREERHRGESVKTEAETGIKLLQPRTTKDGQQPSEAGREAWGSLSTRNQSSDPWSLETSGPQDCEGIYFQPCKAAQ